MRLNNTQFQFVVNSDVEALVSFLQEDYHLSLLDAFDRVYTSKIYKKLNDRRTGLYLQSPEYIYDYLQEEY